MYKRTPGASTTTVEVTAAPAELNTESASLSAESVAEGSELGDLFQYALKQRITVLQNQSALVPIVQAKIDAEKVTIWNSNEKFPLRALWLKNSSGSTLDGGTFNIVESNAFAGEGVLKELKPDERRLISYAADTAVRVKNETEESDQPYTHIKVVRGLVTLTREERDSNKYTIHNSDTVEKNVVIEHPARAGWKFLGDSKPEESTADYHRFRVKVAPGATQELKLAEFHPEETTYALTSITGDQFLFITRGRTVNPKLQEAMQRILEKKNEIGNVDVQLDQRRRELGRISMDQQRLRENMKALKGSAEEKSLTQRYVSQLNQQEDRLATINKDVETLTEQRNRLEQELQTMAQGVSLDEAM
jgi:archaellum component FlaC